MTRVLLLVVVLLLLLWLLRPRRRVGRDGSAQPGGGQVEEMVRCAHCGVHVPRRDAVIARGEAYCSPQHRHAAEAPPPQ